MNCKICNNQFDSIRKLARHIKDYHKMSSQEYYDKYLNTNNEHLCPICKNLNKFINLNLGYHKTCSHICHAKYQNQMMTNVEKEIINNKRKETWSTKNLDEYKSLQSTIQKNRWANIQDKEREKFGNLVSNGIKNMSIEQKRLSSISHSNAIKKRLDNMDNKEKLDFQNKISQGMKNYLSSLSDEEYKNWVDTKNKCLHSDTPEQKIERYKKVSNTMLSKTDEEWAEIKRKETETKRKNNSYTTSKPENRCYDLLKTKFNKVDRCHKTIEYPFNCDLYVEELNLYIECNFYWTHGTHKFSGSKEDLEILDKWKQKASKGHKQYKTAIYVWTELDIKKFNIAKQNNLNFMAFYTENDFQNWFNTL